jgi:hypothetical protein
VGREATGARLARGPSRIIAARSSTAILLNANQAFAEVAICTDAQTFARAMSTTNAIVVARPARAAAVVMATADSTHTVDVAR